MEAPHYHAVKSESFSKTTKTDKKVLTGNTYDSFLDFRFLRHIKVLQKAEDKNQLSGISKEVNVRCVIALQFGVAEL